MLSARPAAALVDDAPLYTKTPGRTLKGRQALQENIIHHGAMTVHSKIRPAKTPYRTTTVRKYVQSALRTAHSLGQS